MDTSVRFHLADFEGPLDLLLFLISKNKLNIMDIPMTLILEQYMDYLNESRAMNLDIASDFIVMAATLILIKTRTLLPKEVREDENEEDPRASLVAALLEYRRFKEISDVFSKRYEVGRDYIEKQAEPVSKSPVMYEYNHDLSALINAVNSCFERTKASDSPSFSSFGGVVGVEPEPVEPKIRFLLKRLTSDGKIQLNSVLRAVKNRSELVAMFLAVLELLNMQKIYPKEEDGDCVLTPFAGE